MLNRLQPRFDTKTYDKLVLMSALTGASESKIVSELTLLGLEEFRKKNYGQSLVLKTLGESKVLEKQSA